MKFVLIALFMLKTCVCSSAQINMKFDNASGQNNKFKINLLVERKITDYNNTILRFESSESQPGLLFGVKKDDEKSKAASYGASLLIKEKPYEYSNILKALESKFDAKNYVHIIISEDCNMVNEKNELVLKLDENGNIKPKCYAVTDNKTFVKTIENENTILIMWTESLKVAYIELEEKFINDSLKKEFSLTNFSKPDYGTFPGYIDGLISTYISSMDKTGKKIGERVLV